MMMQMATMYEKIMDLPLFKGVGKDQVSQFLERTNLEFSNYAIGETVASPGCDVKKVRFIISGEVNVIFKIYGSRISVEERIGAGRVLGADRLFGLNPGYPYRAVATTRTSIMEFSKEQYVSLLHSDSIYMLNFFNYLSLRAQRPIDSILAFGGGGIEDRMRLLVKILTDPESKGITVNGDEGDIAEYCASSESAVRNWKMYLQNNGIAECDSNTIKIISRLRFLEG